MNKLPNDDVLIALPFFQYNFCTILYDNMKIKLITNAALKENYNERFVLKILSRWHGPPLIYFSKMKIQNASVW